MINLIISIGFCIAAIGIIIIAIIDLIKLIRKLV